MINENVVGNSAPSQDVRKERFEIVLTINDSIICQRYFKINGLKNNVFKSYKFVQTLNYCVNLIENDLKLKTNLYNIYTAPQVFNNMEEFNNWKANPYHKFDSPLYILLRDTEEVFVWDGDKLTAFNKRFNVNDYITNKNEEEELPNTLKFTFMDEGRIVYSKIWDGNNYPRFIRNNIDLSNSKNKYDGNLKPYEHYLIKLLTKGREDLIPIIINEICDFCSNDNKAKTNKNNE